MRGAHPRIAGSVSGRSLGRCPGGQPGVVEGLRLCCRQSRSRDATCSPDSSRAACAGRLPRPRPPEGLGKLEPYEKVLTDLEDEHHALKGEPDRRYTESLEHLVVSGTHAVTTTRVVSSPQVPEDEGTVVVVWEVIDNGNGGSGQLGLLAGFGFGFFEILAGNFMVSGP